ncbi:MAG: group III truncated hemoglobin [Thermodesulfobacteriota bacterium]
MRDIENREDIENLVKSFYKKMLADTILGFIFTDIAKVDLEEHLPVICDFWETIIFSTPKYKKGAEVINVHINLNKKIKLKKGHFVRWLYLFHSTVDELFAGSNANRAKEKAHSIAESMQKKLNRNLNLA